MNRTLQTLSRSGLEAAVGSDRLEERTEASDGRSADTRTAIEVLAGLFRAEWPSGFAVRFWDGSEWRPKDGSVVRFWIVVRQPGASRSMLWPPTEMGLAEAYVRGDVDVEGDMEAAVARLRPELGWRGLTRTLALGLRLLRLPRRGPRGPSDREPARVAGKRHSLARDR